MKIIASLNTFNYISKKNFSIRIASNLVNKLSLFSFEIWIIKNKTENNEEKSPMINAKSLVGIMTLNIKNNDELLIIVNEQDTSKLSEVLECFNE